MKQAQRDSAADVRRILMINLHSSRNAGDAALTIVAIEQLKAAFPNAEITLAMNDPASHSGDEQPVGSFMTWLKRIDGTALPKWLWPIALAGMVLRSGLVAVTYRWFRRAVYIFTNSEQKHLLQSYLQADAVVSCAGNFLYSSGRIGVPFLVSVYSIAFALIAGKPLLTMPQSIGPLRHPWERMLLSRVYRRARLVLAREPISYQVARTLGVPSDRCFFIPDIAFALTPASATEGQRVLAEYGVEAGACPLLGVTVIDWGAQSRRFVSQSDYEAAIAASVRSFLALTSGRAVFFSQVTGPTRVEDDRVAARRVIGLLEDVRDRVAFVEGVYPAPLLKSMYGWMDLFLGTRMHSNIFALSQCVPVIAVEYFYKTSGIMRMLDLEEWVVDIRNLQKEQLIGLLERAWLERTCIREHLAEKLPGVVEQASRAGEWVAQYYQNPR